MNALPTQTLCPHCQATQPAHQMMGTQPSFCLECRFPLMYIAGKYPLEQILSQGGQSTVYLGRHHQLKRKAERVIKVLSQEHLATSEAIKRFHREVQVTAELSQLNDHIVRIYDDFGEVPYLGYFYVMEYLQGARLSDYLQQNPDPLAPIWAIDLMLQLCEAIQVAHDNGVIHRDLKPQNLMVLERPSSPLFLKVIDWGIAKTHAEGDITQALTQQAIGTPLYMAPEQVFNDTIDERTDIYSMGVLLYELLTGANPFTIQLQLSSHQQLSDTSMAQAINAQLNHTPPPLHDLLGHSQTTDMLQQIVTTAIAKEPAQRYPHVAALQQALQQAANALHYQVSSDQMPEMQLAAQRDFDLDFDLEQPVRTPHSLDFIDASLRTKALPTGEREEEAPGLQPLPQLHSLSSYPEQDQHSRALSTKPTDDQQASASFGLTAHNQPLPTPSETLYSPTIPGVTTHEHYDDPSDEDQQPARIQLSATNPPVGRDTLSAVQQAYPKHLPLFLWFCSTLGVGMLAGLIWWTQSPDNPTQNTGRRPPLPVPRATTITAQGAVTQPTTKAGNHLTNDLTNDPPEIPPPTSRPIQAPGSPQPLKDPLTATQTLPAGPQPAAKQMSLGRLQPSKRRRLARRNALRNQRRQRKQRKRRQPPQLPRPQARPTPTANACQKGWRWVRVRPFLGHRSEVITEGGSSQRRSPDGLCISSSTRLMSIMQQGYALCIFSPLKQRDPLQLKLKPEAGLHSPNYCVHRP